MITGRNYINGEWTGTENTLDVFSPVNNEHLGTISVASRPEVERAVTAARESLPAWGNLGFRERARYFRSFKKQITRGMSGLIETVNKESGRPFAEIFGHEIMHSLGEIEYSMRAAKGFLKREKTAGGYIIFQPIGAVGLILPRNIVFAGALSQAAAALIMGNTVVLKPSEFLTLSWLKIAEIFQKAGFPRGVFNLVLGPRETGECLVDSGVDKLFFWGSSETGRAIMRRSAERLVPLCLALSGRGTFIVLEDADLESASRSAVWGAFANCGQYCSSVKTIFVADKIAGKFMQSVADKAKSLIVGDPSSAGTDVGPPIDKDSIQILEEYVREAVAGGAVVLQGGKRLQCGEGTYFLPTVLTDVSPLMKIAREEIPGPVLSIIKVKDEHEAVEIINGSVFGLSASVWTKNKQRGEETARLLEAGTVWINSALVVPPGAPWGGNKQSGFGRVGSKYGLLELVNIKYVGVSKGERKKWVFPYRDKYSMTRKDRGVRG